MGIVCLKVKLCTIELNPSHFQNKNELNTGPKLPLHSKMSTCGVYGIFA